jgi:tyrosyl-tRNA synthetase
VKQRISIEDELSILKRGVVDVLPGEDVLVDKLRKARHSGRPLRVKLGIDPTGPVLHLGHTIPLMKLRQFEELDHQTILIIGTFTGLVGDPEGRKTTRPQLSRDEVLRNAERFCEYAERLIDPDKTQVVHNADWLEKMQARDVLELFRKVTVNRLMARDDFALRFEDKIPIHLHELIYPILMGYDSVHLRADVELGATEQTLNIYMGRYLQKSFGQEPQVGVIMPILEGLDGVAKMSKSLNNYIGLDESPERMFAKLLTIPNSQIVSYYTLLTSVPASEIRCIERSLKLGTLNPRDAKRELALEIVKVFHSARAAHAIASKQDIVEHNP